MVTVRTNPLQSNAKPAADDADANFRHLRGAERLAALAGTLLPPINPSDYCREASRMSRVRRIIFKGPTS